MAGSAGACLFGDRTGVALGSGGELFGEQEIQVGNMNHLTPYRGIWRAAAGGLAGFLVLLFARAILLTVVIRHMFGGSLSLWENVVIMGLVPLIVIFGASISARALGATLWHGLVAGTVAMIVIVLILVYGDRNYSPFNNRETLQYVSAISIVVLTTAKFAKDRSFAGRLAVFILAAAFLGMKFAISADEFRVGGMDLKVGFGIALLAWIILPVAAVILSQGRGTE